MCYNEGEMDDELNFRHQSYEVVAICLGQPTPQGWVIHHLNEIPQGNRPENLLLFQPASAHALYHQKLLRLQRKGLEVDATRMALESGAVKLPPPPPQFQLELDIDPNDLYDRLRQQQNLQTE
jgi:hypothetical protein